jgi:hypothetical protein
VTISHARFSYSFCGLAPTSPTATVYLRHCQFLQCAYGLYFGGGYGNPPGSNSVYLQNVLISSNQWVVLGNIFGVYGENITADGCNQGFATTYGGIYTNSTYSGTIINSIFTAVAAGTNFSFNNSLNVSSSSGIYQTLGAASYYLANGSPYQGAGNNNIDAQTLADLQTMTTYPPVLVNYGFSSNTIYSPVVQRNTGALDYGYHYDPIDVAILAYVTNATVTVLPGTVLATYGAGSWYGISLTGGSTLYCQGTATSPVYIVDYNTVQEQSAANFPYYAPGPQGGPAIYFYAWYPGDTSSMFCTFTKWSQLARGHAHLRRFDRVGRLRWIARLPVLQRDIHQ